MWRSDELCEAVQRLKILSNKGTSIIRCINRRNAYYHYLRIKAETKQHGQVIVCSWNIASGLGNDLIKSLLIDTLDTILPDVIILQEPIWKPIKKIFEHMQEAEGDRYSTVAHEYEHYDSPSGCFSLNGKLEVGILYDPKVIQPSFSHELISQRWEEHMADLTKEMADKCAAEDTKEMADNIAAVNTMPMRTIAFGAMATHYQTVLSAHFKSSGEVTKQRLDEQAQLISQMETEQPYFNNFICISVHMFKNTVRQYLILEVAKGLIDKAEKLAREYNRLVIIGADWNFNVGNIQEFLHECRYRQRMYDPYPHFNLDQIHKASPLDSIVYIHPPRFKTPITERPFDWNHQLSKYSAEEKKRIGNHEPIVGNLTIQENIY